jgi:hypothetical protein
MTARQERTLSTNREPEDLSALSPVELEARACECAQQLAELIWLDGDRDESVVAVDLCLIEWLKASVAVPGEILRKRALYLISLAHQVLLLSRLTDATPRLPMWVVKVSPEAAEKGSRPMGTGA